MLCIGSDHAAWCKFKWRNITFVSIYLCCLSLVVKMPTLVPWQRRYRSVSRVFSDAHRYWLCPMSVRGCMSNNRLWVQWHLDCYSLAQRVRYRLHGTPFVKPFTGIMLSQWWRLARRVKYIFILSREVWSFSAVHECGLVLV